DVASSSVSKAGSYFAALPEEDRAPMRAWAQSTYGPVYRAMKAREASLDQGETLLLQTLYSNLLEMGEMEAERQALADKAAAYVGVDGSPDPEAVSANELSAAMKWGTTLGGRDFYEAALEHARTTDNQLERRTILQTLVTYADEPEMADLIKEMQGSDWQGQETWSVLQASLNNEANQDAAWALYQASCDNVISRTPEIRKAQTAGAVRSFCTEEKVAEASAFFEGKKDAIPGYERSLAQARESGNLCAAFRSGKVEELKAAIAER
ncbi:MAG: ERAP1-like C-terminal domain-containing protein, partial [Henriciella sp.]